MPFLHLPDDFLQWPDDPLLLLGILPDASMQELRRAYTRLIKLFKPESAPEQFKRIRSAYEQATQQFSYRDRLRRNDPDAAHLTTQEQETWQVARPDHIPRFHNTFENEQVQNNPTLKNVLSDSWSLAKQGKVEEAFSLLQTCHQTDIDSPGNSSQLYVQMYWLARIFPELQQNPLHWLAVGIGRPSPSDLIVETLQREFAERPASASHPALSEAILRMRCENAMLPCMRSRWYALAQQCQPGTILQDLTQLQSDFLYDQEEAWNKLLMSGVEAFLLAGFFHPKGLTHAFGEQGIKPIQPYLDELNIATHSFRLDAEQWDHLDSLFHLTNDLLLEEDLTGSKFLRRWGWFIQQHLVCREFPQITQLPCLIADLVQDPLQGLRELTRLFHSNPTLAAQLDHLLEQYAQLRDVELPERSDTRKPLHIPSKLVSQTVHYYDEDFRPFIAEHAFHDAMQPQHVVQRLCGETFTVSFITESVASDQTLQALYRAWYAFHHVPRETDQSLNEEESLSSDTTESELAATEEDEIAATASTEPKLPLIVIFVPVLLLGAASVAIFIIWYQIYLAQAVR